VETLSLFVSPLKVVQNPKKVVAIKKNKKAAVVANVPIALQETIVLVANAPNKAMKRKKVVKKNKKVVVVANVRNAVLEKVVFVANALNKAMKRKKNIMKRKEKRK